MQQVDHPSRRWAVDEMHVRRFAPVRDHCEIYQSVRLFENDERAAELDRLKENRPHFAEWDWSARHASGQTRSGIHFLWERHTEASTVTLILPDGCAAEVRQGYIDWFEGWGGATIRATRVFVFPEDHDIEKELHALDFDLRDLVCSDIAGGLRIWSDFNIHEDGYGRLIVRGGAVTDEERGRIVQRIQELSNYRNLALMGLPVVQEHTPTVNALEQRLADHSERVAHASEDADDDALLQQLADISSQLEVIRSATEFRLSATTAYAEVAGDRLETLAIRPVPNFQDLTDFTERRLVPAARTCSVFRTRLARLAERIARVMHTLDVRIDTRIKAQNLQLTRSMERSIQLQFRLQSLVEGLSVIAAAYYLVGLIGYVVKGTAGLPEWRSAEVLIGLVTLPVVALIYWLVRRWRGTMLRETDLD